MCARTRACAASTCETSLCSKSRLASNASDCNAVNVVRAQSHALAYAPRVSMLQRGTGVSAESQHGQSFHREGARPVTPGCVFNPKTRKQYLNPKTPCRVAPAQRYTYMKKMMKTSICTGISRQRDTGEIPKKSAGPLAPSKHVTLVVAYSTCAVFRVVAYC